MKHVVGAAWASIGHAWRKSPGLMIRGGQPLPLAWIGVCAPQARPDGERIGFNGGDSIRARQAQIDARWRAVRQPVGCIGVALALLSVDSRGALAVIASDSAHSCPGSGRDVMADRQTPRTREPVWPTVEEQLAAAKVVHGTALERLVLENQDFSLLKPEEAETGFGSRRGCACTRTSRIPTHSLRRVIRQAATRLRCVTFTSGWSRIRICKPSRRVVQREGTQMPTNLRLSGAQTTPRRSRISASNYANLEQLIAASTHLSATQPIHYSGDGGATWTQTELPAFRPPDVR